MGSIYIDFRNTAPYVTDPAGATYCIGEAYPVTRGGATFGWVGGVLSTQADLSNTNPAQLAGINYRDNTLSAVTFQLDLADGPGTYKIGVAMGAATAAEPEQHAIFQDGATTLFTVSNSVGPGVNQFADASSAIVDAASWLSGQVYRTVTLAGSSLTVTIGGGSAGSGFSCLASLYAEFVSGTTNAMGDDATSLPTTLALPTPAKSIVTVFC